MNNLNFNLSFVERQYQAYKNAIDKQSYLSDHWLHADFTVTAKSWIGKWLDKCCLTRYLYRKFCHIDLQTSLEQVIQIKVEILTPPQKKQLKHACKLLACFGQTKLGWKEGCTQLTRLNTLISSCKFLNIEKLLKDLWSADEGHQKDLKYWPKRIPKAPVSVQSPQASTLNLDERESWLTQGLKQGLEMCACTTSQTRADYEKELVSKLVRQFPPATHPELTLMSVGAGDLLQDWILLNEIAQQGYKKVYLQLVDPETSKARVEQFTEMAKALAASKNIEIQIELAPNLKAVAPGKKFDCIHAIDFKLTYMPYWETLAEGLDYLAKPGFVYTTAFNAQFAYSSESRQWDVRGNQQFESPLPAVKVEETVKFAIQNFEHFWQHDLGVIADLVANKVRRIQIDLLCCPDIEIPNFEKLLQKLFSIDIVVKYNNAMESDSYHLASIPKDKLSREIAAQLLQAFKPGGALLLSGSPYFREESTE